MVAAAASSTIFWAWPAAAAVAAVALLMLADRFSGLCHARLHAPWIIRRRIAHHAPPYDVLLARELLLRGSRGGSARSVFELWQHFEPFLGAGRQCHLFVGESQRLVRDDNQ